MYKGVTTQSLYILMSDGAKIAIDLLRPRSAPADLRLPTILIIARYWRSFALRGLTQSHRAPIGPRKHLADFLVPRGYTVVVMDSRGSGASTGSTPYPFNEREIRDYGEVVEWIIRQPWSDGKVVVSQQADIDQYAEFLLPGGIPSEWLIRTWQHTNEALDRNRFPTEWASGGSERRSLLIRMLASISSRTIKGVRPVDADRDGSELRRAVVEHGANGDVAAYARAVTFRDDPFGPSGVTIEAFNTTRYHRQIERSGAAIFTWGSWFDGCTADGVIRRFASYDNPQRGVIGAWSHGYLNHGSPYCTPRSPLRPPLREQWQEILEYLDHYLRAAPDQGQSEKALVYYTLGEETWKITDIWPPAGSTTERWYLAAGNGLAREAPTVEEGSDIYQVDFEATTGLTNRWRTQDGVGRVVYGNRAGADERLLTYTSLPLSRDMEIAGHPVITLLVASTAEDGAFHVYLEDVDEKGNVTYVTEGLLRAVHRRVSDQRPSLALFVPYHSFLRQDGAPLVPGEVAELRFGLLPVSGLLRMGHRLRVAIAGADTDTFARIPAQGEPTITVYRNRRHASHIELPVIRS